MFWLGWTFCFGFCSTHWTRDTCVPGTQTLFWLDCWENCIAVGTVNILTRKLYIVLLLQKTHNENETNVKMHLQNLIHFNVKSMSNNGDALRFKVKFSSTHHHSIIYEWQSHHHSFRELVCVKCCARSGFDCWVDASSLHAVVVWSCETELAFLKRSIK